MILQKGGCGTTFLCNIVRIAFTKKPGLPGRFKGIGSK